MAERGSASCDTARPDGTIDGFYWNGTSVNWSASNHIGWVADAGTNTYAGATVLKDGSQSTTTYSSANKQPVWCYSE